jgi:hypothetical protein
MTDSHRNTVWLSPSATTFSCLCEPCLDAAREGGLLFAEALAAARVTGTIGVDSAVAVARCVRGHQLVLRRVERPPGLGVRDARQLELV